MYRSALGFVCSRVFLLGFGFEKNMKEVFKVGTSLQLMEKELVLLSVVIGVSLILCAYCPTID